jgi:transcriptional regulator with XRE-family HTH domain
MDNNGPSEFGRWLKEARGERGLTQQGLADALGPDENGEPIVHVNTIKNLEAGKTKRPSAQKAAALRRFFGSEPTPEEVTTRYDRHTESFLDLVGAYLMSLPSEKRLDKIFELTRHLLSGK